MDLETFCQLPSEHLSFSLSLSLCSVSASNEGDEEDDTEMEKVEGVLSRSTIHLNSHLFVTLTHQLAERRYVFSTNPQPVPSVDGEREREGEGGERGREREVVFANNQSNFVIREKGNYFRRLLVEVAYSLSFSLSLSLTLSLSLSSLTFTHTCAFTFPSLTGVVFRRIDG